MKKVLLIGNPNTGKTTLYNTLTGSNEHVGNWHGVTVDAKKNIISKLKDTELIDLPGLYSVNTLSPEEKVTADALEENKDSLVVNICDANNLSRNLFLTMQLKERGYNVCLAVNMAKELKNNGEILRKLSEKLEVPVFPIDARKGRKCKALVEYIASFEPKKNLASFSTVIEALDDAFLMGQAKVIYNKIDALLKAIGYFAQSSYGKSALDKILLTKPGAIISFISIFMLVFTVTFGDFGQSLSDALGVGFGALTAKILPSGIGGGWFYAFITDGVLAGVVSLLSFLPQIMLLFFFINLLEDIGYLSRVAFMLDGSLGKVGLNGRSIFSLLMGFGCTTSALMTTRNLEGEKLRKRTALLLPNFSCSAKLPIYACICSAFFMGKKTLVVLALYALGVGISVIIALILSKTGKAEEKSFIMEMPKIRMPSASKLAKSMLGHARDFVTRVGSVIVVMSAIMWFLMNFNFRLGYVAAVGGEPIIGVISKFLAPVFAPLGIGSPAIVMALLSGLVAKEMVLGALVLANGVGSIGELSASLFLASSPAHFTTATALSFLVFVLFYPACISAMSAAVREFGWKTALLSIGLQFAIAYLMAFATFNLFSAKSALSIVAAIIFVAVLALCVVCVINYNKKNCKGACGGCKFKLNDKKCL